MPAEEVATLGHLLARGTRTLTGTVDAPRGEAARLWSDLSGRTAGEAWLHGDQAVPPEVADRFRRAVERRRDGWPAAYATGRAGFRHLVLQVEPGVLIPRPETEGLVDRVLEQAPDRGTVVELGVGSGCILLSLATEGTFRRLVGVERSPVALAVARRNQAVLAPDAPIEWWGGNWCEPLQGERFDVVVSNPPYLTDAEYEALDPSVRDHEPREALVGGPDGLDPIRSIAGDARRVLNAGGVLVLEIDAGRGGATRDLVRQAGFHGVRVERDLFGRDRYLLATWPGPVA